MKKVTLMLSVGILILSGCSSNDSISTVDNKGEVLQSSAEDRDALIAEMPLPEYNIPIEEAEEILKNAKVYYAKDPNTFSTAIADVNLTQEEREQIKVEKTLNQYVTLDGYTYNFHMTSDEAKELGISDSDYSGFVEKINWMNNRIKIIVASGGTIGLKDPQTGDFINVSLTELSEESTESSIISRVDGNLPPAASGVLTSMDYQFETSENLKHMFNGKKYCSVVHKDVNIHVDFITRRCHHGL